MQKPTSRKNIIDDAARGVAAPTLAAPIIVGSEAPFGNGRAQNRSIGLLKDPKCGAWADAARGI